MSRDRSGLNPAAQIRRNCRGQGKFTLRSCSGFRSTTGNSPIRPPPWRA